MKRKESILNEVSLYIRQEHLAPTTAFSFAANAHEQFKAGFSPHEHFAWEAQTHVEDELRPQQVDGSVMLLVGCICFSFEFGYLVRRVKEVVSDDDFLLDTDEELREGKRRKMVGFYPKLSYS